MNIRTHLFAMVVLGDLPKHHGFVFANSFPFMVTQSLTHGLK